MADDQRWGDMAYNSHPLLQTPNFESVAKESLRFDDFYAAARICSTTHGSVLTGRYPNHFACFMWRNTPSPRVVTIAEVLKKAGYSTGHFGSGRNGSSVNQGAGGFNEWSCYMVRLAMEIT